MSHIISNSIAKLKNNLIFSKAFLSTPLEMKNVNTILIYLLILNMQRVFGFDKLNLK